MSFRVSGQIYRLIFTLISLVFLTINYNQEIVAADSRSSTGEKSKISTSLAPEVTAELILGGTAIFGSIVAWNQNRISEKREKWEILFESLKWFGKDPHWRSSAISVVETKWKNHSEFRQRWASIFVTQIIFILKKSNNFAVIDSETKIDQVNVIKMMNLLTKGKNNGESFAQDLSLDEINSLNTVIKKLSDSVKSDPSIKKTLFISMENLKSWCQELETLQKQCSDSNHN